MASVLQMLYFVAEFGMSPEAAAHQPRIDVSGPDLVTADQRLAPDIMRVREADGPLADRRARGDADQLRLPEPDPAVGRRAHRHQRCDFAVVRGGGAGLTRYFFNTRTGLPASHCLMSSTICV